MLIVGGVYSTRYNPIMERGLCHYCRFNKVMIGTETEDSRQCGGPSELTEMRLCPVWFHLLCPHSASLNPPKLGQVRLGHFLCVLGIFGICVISTQWAKAAAPSGSLRCQGQDRQRPRQHHAATRPTHIPLSLTYSQINLCTIVL